MISDPILIGPCTLLLGAALQISLSRLRNAKTKGIVAVLSCLPAVAAVAWSLPSVRAGQAIHTNLTSWDGPLALVFHVDALSVLFAFMGALLGFIVLLYSIGYMAHDTAATRFYCTMLLFIGGFMGLVCSANLFLIYLSWELIGLCSFSLVGFWYTNKEAVNGARKVLLMTHIAGYGLLAAVLVLYQRTGSAIWTDPGMTHAFTGSVFLLMLVALVAKSVQVPMHTWIPEAMAAPTPVSSLLHAACYVTAGVYLAARMHSFGVWPASWGACLVWIGTVTMAIGVMYAMVQTDLKRMLAFSTISQIGYMMLGLGIGTPLSITAALLHCLNHGFFKGGLFLNAGAVQHATGTRNMNELGGLAARMPHTALWWLIGVGNMAGIPLMSGFVSKWMLYAAALQAGWTVPAIIAWTVSLGTVFLCAKATSSVFLGDLTEKAECAQEGPMSMQWAMGLMAAGSLVLGIAPQLAVNYLLDPILSALSLGPGVQLTWFGLFTGAGSFSSIGGLVLALVSVVTGGGIYAIAYFARPVSLTSAGGGSPALAGAAGEIFTGGEPLSGPSRLTASDFSQIFEQNWRTFFIWSNVDRVYLAFWRALHESSRLLGLVVLWMERHAVPLLVAIPIALLFGVRWLPLGAPSIEILSPQRLATPLVLVCSVAAIELIVAAIAQAEWRHLATPMILTSAAAIAGLTVEDLWTRVGFLELSALLTIPMVWLNAKSLSGKLVYIAVVSISAVSLIASELSIEHAKSNWAGALLLTSACVKLAAFPLFFWLLRLADELPALVLGLLIAVVDVAAFAEIYLVVTFSPQLLGAHTIWLSIGAITSLLASFLMLSQRSLKRLLVLSTIEDIGILFLGLFSGNALGQRGALIAAATHSVAKALLFTCISAPEAHQSLQTHHTGLISRYPVSAFGFLFGMLAMLGVPPTFGYIGRWRLYETALGIHPMLLACFLLSSIFALIAFVMALTGVWWGPPHDQPDWSRTPINDNPQRLHNAICEPLPLKVAIVGIVMLLLGGGVWPRALQELLGGLP